MSDKASVGPIGPVDLALVQFADGHLNDQVVSALADLVDRGVVAIVDLLMVSKTENGEIELVELADAQEVLADRLADLDGEVMWLLSANDVSTAASALDPGSTGVVVVWENLWARDLRMAVDAAGGKLLVHDRLDADEVLAAMKETSGA